MYLGSWAIDSWLTFPCNTHKAGEAFDADSDPLYRIYEDETGTPVTTGTLTKLDDGNTTGFYTERIQLLAATGFEKGKSYTIYEEATVNGVKGTVSHTFQIEAKVDAKTVSDKTGYTVSTVQDKTGYSLAVTPPTVTQIQAEMEEEGASILDSVKGKLPTHYIAGKANQADLNDITATSVWAVVIEGTKTALGFLRLILSAVTLKTTGGGTPELKSRDLADTKDRIVLGVDENGNRTSVDLDEN